MMIVKLLGILELNLTVLTLMLMLLSSLLG